MRAAWLLAGLVALVPACEVTDDQRVTEACSVICGCEKGPLPALQEQCIADCKNDFQSFSGITDQCISCVSANRDRCVTLEMVCEPICDPPTPTEDAPL